MTTRAPLPLVTGDRAPPPRLPIALALLGIVLEASGFSLLPPMLPQFVEQLRLSGAAAGWLSSGYAAGSIAGGLLGIVLVPRAGVRPSTAAAFALLAAPLPVLAAEVPFAALETSRVVAGVGSGLLWAALLTWINRVTGDDRRGQVLGLATAAAVTGNLIGPPLGALAVEHGRATVCGALAGVTVVIGVVTVLAQRRGGPTVSHDQ